METFNSLRQRAKKARSRAAWILLAVVALSVAITSARLTSYMRIPSVVVWFAVVLLPGLGYAVGYGMRFNRAQRAAWTRRAPIRVVGVDLGQSQPVSAGGEVLIPGTRP